MASRSTNITLKAKRSRLPWVWSPFWRSGAAPMAQTRSAYSKVKTKAEELELLKRHRHRLARAVVASDHHATMLVRISATPHRGRAAPRGWCSVFEEVEVVAEHDARLRLDRHAAAPWVLCESHLR